MQVIYLNEPLAVRKTTSAEHAGSHARSGTFYTVNTAVGASPEEVSPAAASASPDASKSYRKSSFASKITPVATVPESSFKGASPSAAGNKSPSAAGGKHGAQDGSATPQSSMRQSTMKVRDPRHHSNLSTTGVMRSSSFVERRPSASPHNSVTESKDILGALAEAEDTVKAAPSQPIVDPRMTVAELEAWYVEELSKNPELAGQLGLAPADTASAASGTEGSGCCSVS